MFVSFDDVNVTSYVPKIFSSSSAVKRAVPCFASTKRTFVSACYSSAGTTAFDLFATGVEDAAPLA